MEERRGGRVCSAPVGGSGRFGIGVGHCGGGQGDTEGFEHKFGYIEDVGGKDG